MGFKKLGAVCLAFALLGMIGCGAHADETQRIDFSKMSLDELSRMYEAFSREFQKRRGAEYSGPVLLNGVNYIVGIDIEPGVYRFKVLGQNDDPYLCVKAQHVQNSMNFIELEEHALPFELVIGDTICLERCFGVLVPEAIGGY